MALDKLRAFAEGFIGQTKRALEKSEIDTMALGTFTITMEPASRFLDDYLLGDKYFKVNYEGHSLVRARCRPHLAKDMLEKYERMCAIIAELTDKE